MEGDDESGQRMMERNGRRTAKQAWTQQPTIEWRVVKASTPCGSRTVEAMAQQQ